MTEPCKSCQAEVVFVPSAKTGKPMILDAQPKKGVVVLPVIREGQDGPLYRGAIGPYGPDVAAVVDVFTDHHVTCPAAAAWKGKTRKDPP